MIFIPGSPVLVPDDGEDDDISILEVNDSRCFNITFSLLKTQMDGFSSSFFSFFFCPVMVFKNLLICKKSLSLSFSAALLLCAIHFQSKTRLDCSQAHDLCLQSHITVICH